MTEAAKEIAMDAAKVLFSDPKLSYKEAILIAKEAYEYFHDVQLDMIPEEE